MKKVESLRETLSSLLTPEYLKQKEEAGWRPVAVEWQREVTLFEARSEEGTPSSPEAGAEEIPFGLRIASDCHHLEENAGEMEVLKVLAELIVQDLSFPEMAAALNQRGFRTRGGQLWSSLGVFKLTPRLIDVAPRILAGSEWETRKKQITRVAWNS
jgi:hypothetical protein